MCIIDDFLTAQEYATEGDRKNKFSNIKDEEDGEIVPDMMIELQRGANSELYRKFPSHKQIKPTPTARRARDWCMVKQKEVCEWKK